MIAISWPNDPEQWLIGSYRNVVSLQRHVWLTG